MVSSVEVEDELDVVGEVALLAEEDDALLSELDEDDALLSELGEAEPLLLVEVLPSPLQATIAPAYDAAPANKKNDAFPRFMKEPPRRVTEAYILQGSGQKRLGVFIREFFGRAEVPSAARSADAGGVVMALPWDRLANRAQLAASKKRETRVRVIDSHRTA